VPQPPVAPGTDHTIPPQTSQVEGGLPRGSYGEGGSASCRRGGGALRPISDWRAGARLLLIGLELFGADPDPLRYVPTLAAGERRLGTSSFLRQVQNEGRGYDMAYNLNGSVTSGSIGPVGGAGGVPEPSTWAMLILGFAGVRAAERRRAAARA